MNLQKTYDLLECNWYDKGLSGDGNHNTNWINLNNNIIVSYSDECTTLTPTQNNANNRFSVPTANVPAQPFIIDFKKHGTSETGEYMVICGQGVQFSTLWNGAIASANHIIFTVKDNKVYCEHDGVTESSTFTISNPSDVIRFQINNNTGSIKFSDLKIYPV